MRKLLSARTCTPAFARSSLPATKLGAEAGGHDRATGDVGFIVRARYLRQPGAVAEKPGAFLVQGRSSSTLAPASPNGRDHGPIDSRRSGAVAQPVRAGDS